MKIEIRANDAVISGYVNVTGKKSRPVMTPHGRVIEEIEPRAFEEALARAGEVTLTVDHDKGHIYASTTDNSLILREDEIGLHAEVTIRDKELCALARAGKIRGWSFGMYNVRDTVEARADELPLRRISALDLDHVSLIVGMNPVYSATSVEVRADGETEMEERASLMSVSISIPPDLDGYRQRVEALKRK